MKQVLIRAGDAHVAEIPAPCVDPKTILVQVLYSCISVGTEMASVKMSALPLYKRALKQPENVKKVLEIVKEQGLAKTLKRVQGKLTAGSPTGYSAAGIVLEVGSEVDGFSVGQRVACAGAGIANHAEIIRVPVNLAVKVPDELDLLPASTVTLGAIALQGVRRFNPTLGETVVVVGLGILGQIVTQLLLANGCHVIGIDLQQDRIQKALDKGMNIGLNSAEESYVEKVLAHTDGFGADGVIITAASSSDTIMHEAMNACRKKGRVVLVGDVGLNLKRDHFYKKELDFFISCSYGPGRYDSVYEEEGQDYPLPYVRWTENRNMESYLSLLSSGKVSLDGYYSAPFSIENATKAYQELQKGSESPLAVFLQYPSLKQNLVRKVFLNTLPKIPHDKVGVGFAGAGGFAQGVHLPNLAKMKNLFHLKGIMSHTGSNAKAVGMQYEASYVTTDYEEILRDPDIQLVILSTRHDLHASMALQALKAGKNVFVEKPLALIQEDLDKFDRFFAQTKSSPLLMVGFNRRFSPTAQKAKEILQKRTTPLVINYRMNAGYIPLDHWVHGKEGGGRNIGEACHIYDLFNFFTDSEIEDVQALSIYPSGRQWSKNDNFIATFRYKDGSICSLTYTALGNKTYPKERMEIFSDGMVLSLDDYKTLSVVGSSQKGISSSVTQKGHEEELRLLGNCLLKGGNWPISFEQQKQATWMSFEVERQLY